jgi:hypothetical protein
VAWWALLVAHIHPLVHHGHLDPAHLGLGAALLWWTVMIAAMMLPWVAADARWLAFRSLPRLRRRAITVFAAAFLLVWALEGAVALTTMTPLHGSLPAVVLALAVAAAWHVAPRAAALQRAPGAGNPRPARVPGLVAVGRRDRGRRCIAYLLGADAPDGDPALACAHGGRCAGRGERAAVGAQPGAKGGLALRGDGVARPGSRLRARRLA